MIDKEKVEFNNENEEITEENPFEQEEVLQEEQFDAKKLEEELEKQKNQYIRLAADFDNYRKRQEQEREALLKYGAEDTIKKLLPIIDSIERAQKSFQELDDCKKLKDSFEAIQKQLSECLDKIGLTKIPTVGENFDPNLHEAVMQTPTEEHEDHSIITELQTGYKLYDRIVRPAMVNVAVKE
ncbi:MAG TPA: nucleotide exchange factor GrpE [Candidatus Gastranaerophilales bacterium]|nr:nucleotide exchange factor GrpE [Candidatus Gastranaerophilales bacterium]